MTPLLVVPRELLAIPPWQPARPPRGPLCTAPRCPRTAGHQHHAVARSQQRSILGTPAPYDWLLIDDTLVLVLVDLCPICHDLLESGWNGCRARLRWAGGWAWYNRVADSELTGDTDHIFWHDPKTGLWKLKGFCRGEYDYAKLGS